MSGKIQTVLGPIDPSALGVTLTHEHLIIDSGALAAPYNGPTRFASLCDTQMTMDNLWWIRQYPYSSRLNAKMYEDIDAVEEEMNFYKSNGGHSFVDATTEGISRDVKGLKQLSLKSGVNVIAGAGFYVESSRPHTVHYSLETMSDIMTTEMIHGADETDIKCGVIGELGCSWPLTGSEKRVLQAAAGLEAEHDFPVIVHPGRNPTAPQEIVRIYQEAGGHVNRFVMSHLDRTINNVQDLVTFAEMGTYLEFDLFGIETSYYQLWEEQDMPSDAQRIARIKGLIDAGYEEKIVIAHDIHTKHRLMKYGGHGFSHILLNVIPMMLQRELSQESIDKILKENPKRWLTFK